jgi:hypothetical protein
MAWATRKPGAPVVEADNPRTPLPSCHRAVTRDEARRIAVTLTAGRVCKLAAAGRPPTAHPGVTRPEPRGRLAGAPTSLLQCILNASILVGRAAADANPADMGAKPSARHWQRAMVSLRST